MELYDPKTGHPVYVPEREAAGAVQSGSLGLDTTQDYMMVDRDGQVWAFKGKDAVDALNAGFRFEGAEEGRARNVRVMYGDDNMAALAAGIGRGLSFGLSDVILTETGLVDAETLAGLKEANPDLSAAGEIGAIATSMLLPGGQTAALKALRGMGAPTRAVAKGSQAMERTVGNLLGAPGARGFIGKSLAKGAAVGTGSAVEGALYGGGQWVSENALGNPDAVAENLMSYVGTGALYGGLFGAGLGSTFGAGAVAARKAGETVGDILERGGKAVNSGVSEVAAKLQKSGRLSEEAAKGIQNLWERGEGQSAIVGLMETLAGRKGALDELLAPGEAGVKARAKATLDFDEYVADMGKKHAGLQDEMSDLLRETTKGITGVDKKARMADALYSEGTVDAAKFATLRDLKQAKDALTEIVGDKAGATYVSSVRLKRLNARIDKTIKEYEGMDLGKYKRPEMAAMPKGLADVLTEMDRLVAAGEQIPKNLQKKFAKMTGLSDEAAKKEAQQKAKMFMDLDEIKRDLGREWKRYGSLNQKTLQSIDTEQALGRMYMDGFRSTLEDASVWGKQATDIQREINKAWVPYLQKASYRTKHRLNRFWQEEDLNNVLAGAPSKQFRNDSKGWEDFFRNTGDENAISMDKEWLLAQTQNKINLMEAANKQYKGRFAEQLSKAKKIQKEMLKDLEGSEAVAGLQNQLKSIEAGAAQSGITGAGLGGVIGFGLGGVPGAVIGGFAGSLANPANLVRQLATLDRLSARYASKVNIDIKKYTNKAKKLAKEAAKTAAKTTMRAGKRMEDLGRRLKTPKKPKKVWGPIGKRRAIVTPATVGAIHRSIDAKREKRVKDRATAYKRRVKELSTLLGNPDATREQLERSLKGIAQVAPKTAESMVVKANQALAFLMSKAPKSPYPDDRFGGSRWRPSESEISKFERYLAVFHDPSVVLKDLKQGTLTHEAVEGLREMYPEIYSQIVTSLTEQVSEVGDPLPYTERVQLSVLFGFALDPTMSPEFVRGMQEASSMGQPAEGGKPAPRPPKAPIRPERAMTKTQRLEQGSV